MVAATDVYCNHFSVVAAGQTNLRMFIVYVVADLSLVLFLDWSLKSATQVSRLNLTAQYLLAMKTG